MLAGIILYAATLLAVAGGDTAAVQALAAHPLALGASLTAAAGLTLGNAAIISLLGWSILASRRHRV